MEAPVSVFIHYHGRIIRHVGQQPWLCLSYWYLDVGSGREFDIRELPSKYLQGERLGLAAGDLDAHKRILLRAIEDQYGFW